MKNKREKPRVYQRPQFQSVLLLIVFSVSALLIFLLGMLYKVPLRFTVPPIILLVWFSTAMALWLFGKRQS